MIKKTKLFALPKFGGLRGSTSASLKIGGILVTCKKIGEFFKLKEAIILLYLVTDLFLYSLRGRP